MENKQTAVEWLVTQLPLGVKNTIMDKIEQAKEMEKEQMRIIYNGLLNNVGTYVLQSDLLNFEEYYNKTYNS